MICIQTTRRGGTSRDWYRAKPVWALSIIIASPLSLPPQSFSLSLPPSISPLITVLLSLWGPLLPINTLPCQLSFPATYFPIPL